MKIPLLFVQKSNVVSMSKYKSTAYDVYSIVFETTFTKVAESLTERGIQFENDSKSKCDLIALKFPKIKVLEFASRKGEPNSETLQFREKTSLTDFVKLYKANSMMMPLTTLLRKLLDSTSDPKHIETVIRVRILIQKILSSI